MSIAVDNRQVVLLKSRRTNNRFYTLVEPESGFKNADAIDDFPRDLPLGIAYPCLEDGLNDFAVIRTTFETIEVFRDDEELRKEMMGIIADSRGNLVRRLEELRDGIVAGRIHFLGTNLQEFKDHVLHMATRGTIRRQLDSMMKVDVFESVAQTEAVMRGGTSEPMYRHEFLPEHALNLVDPLVPRRFIGRVFDDILDAVTDDRNYEGKYTFDKRVFQKFIAVMFVNYATTDPLFYGTNPKDYGVDQEREMGDTPLYQAVAAALRQLEREWQRGEMEDEDLALPPRSEEDLSFLFQDQGGVQILEQAGHSVEIPFGAAERMLLEPLALLADALRLLQRSANPREKEAARLAGAAGHQIFRGLQELKIVSPLARNPLEGVDE
jgi:hypothetical protein